MTGDHEKIAHTRGKCTEVYFFKKFNKETLEKQDH